MYVLHTRLALPCLLHEPMTIQSQPNHANHQPSPNNIPALICPQTRSSSGLAPYWLTTCNPLRTSTPSATQSSSDKHTKHRHRRRVEKLESVEPRLLQFLVDVDGAVWRRSLFKK
ncbi:hypothetical protein BDBG_04071 [Blastomyces gilchristii SLH14081]|uniref:Uncharacterized protein n=1 Tax=Blastomyces gilchristii (strain SLH14081) TaxID=559298 RepID=A0A179ULH7_BLAGS|nr:uncharacterized protein BDBG_04071 [Blastomyces gilchristii SLH14081]OAT08079.1 hypothetical protein BDBG_04071 [Blastomyces gilchristii SLH14081]